MATKIGKSVRREVSLPDGRVAIISMGGHGIGIRTKGRRGRSEVLIEWGRIFALGNVSRPRPKKSAEPDRLETERIERLVQRSEPAKTCSAESEHRWGPWKTGGMGRSRRCLNCGRIQIEK